MLDLLAQFVLNAYIGISAFLVALYVLRLADFPLRERRAANRQGEQVEQLEPLSAAELDAYMRDRWSRS